MIGHPPQRSACSHATRSPCGGAAAMPGSDGADIRGRARVPRSRASEARARSQKRRPHVGAEDHLRFVLLAIEERVIPLYRQYDVACEREIEPASQLPG